VYPGAAAGVLYLYLRFYKGMRLTDLMYVTRSSLDNMKKAMGESGWPAMARWRRRCWAAAPPVLGPAAAACNRRAPFPTLPLSAPLYPPPYKTQA
jgi:hypothetical protein